jgi:integrase
MRNALEQAIGEYTAAVDRLSEKAPKFADCFPPVETLAITEPLPAARHTESPEGTNQQTPDSPSEKPRLRGFGYLYRRGSLWWIRYSHRGNDFRESSGSESEREAMRLLKKRWKEIGKGRFIGPSEDRVMMDDLLDALVVDYQNNKRRSLEDLNGRLKHLRAAFGNMRAIDVSEDRVERYKVSRLGEKRKRGTTTIRPATVNRELAALRKAFSLAVRQKRIAAAPAIAMLAENNARQGFLEPADFEMIAKNLPAYLRDFARFGYISGWRKGELQTLAWADVNREADTILLRSEHSKNKEPRLLPLSGELAAIVERRWQARAIENPNGSTGLAHFVFHCGDGRPVGDFRKAWATACSEAKMPGILFHDLRRSAVRNLDRSGVGQAVAMKITGHKTISVYQRYRIVSESDLRDALERTQAAIASSKERRVIAMTSEAK